MLFTSTLRCRVGACDFFRWRPHVLVCWVADFFRLAPDRGRGRFRHCAIKDMWGSGVGVPWVRGWARVPYF